MNFHHAPPIPEGSVSPADAGSPPAAAANSITAPQKANLRETDRLWACGTGSVEEWRNAPIGGSLFPTAMPTGPAYGLPQSDPWSEFAALFSQRRQGDKDGPCLVLADLEPEADGQVRRLGKNLRWRTAIALDIETNKETGEIPPPFDEVRERLKARGLAAIIYTSHSHTTARPRYRIILQISEPIACELPVVPIVADLLGLGGVLDTSKLGAASLFYLPSAPPGGLDGHAFADVEGMPLDAARLREEAGAVLAAKEAEQKKQRAEAMEAANRRREQQIARGGDPDASIIKQLRDRLNLEDELLSWGYIRVRDRTYLYPGSQTGEAGVHVMIGADGVERVYSHHAGDPVAAGNLPSWCTVKAIDVVDLVVIRDYGGDRTKGLAAMARRYDLGSKPRLVRPVPPPSGPDDYGIIETKPRQAQEANGAEPPPDDKPPEDEPADAASSPPPEDDRGGGHNSSTESDLDGFDLTEDGIALAFAKHHKDDLRFDHTRGAWFQWTGIAWRQDETKRAFSWARRRCREMAMARGVAGNKTLAKAATAAAVERFAQSDQALAVTSATWDQDDYLLGTPGGTVDLRTAELRAPAIGDHITKLTAITPSETPDCPQWLAFLDQVTKGDQALIRFLKQWCGYCLTGDICEHALLFAHGPGGNGKGVFLNTIAGIMGDYATTAAMDCFTASTNDKHPTDLAMLRGARLVSASETEDGQAWAESRIKQLTGGDPITARFMRQDFFTFKPKFKLTIIGNHQPVLRNVDEAARRRINMAPFVFKPPVKDKQLESKLRQEWPSILRWMIEGCLDWLKNGLIRPEVVQTATDTYFSEQDMVHQWVEECCDMKGHDTLAVLFKSWSDYAQANGEKHGTTKWFSQTLARLGCKPVKSTPGQRGKRGFIGISVKLVKSADWTTPAEQHDDEPGVLEEV